MNTIFSNYSEIDMLELNNRISFYEHSEFSTESIELLIPDTVPYVRKIFNCLRWATQNRQIIEDVCRQIVDYRITRNQLIQSVAYSVGTLQLDGRAYAQQNIHQYCRYIAETNDCLCQILNIVFGVGFRQWNRFEMDDLRKHPSIKGLPHILALWDKYRELIRIHKNFDNFDKHNLILWGYEKLTPQCNKNVEYYFDRDGQQIKMSDWINAELEHKIKVAILELLDNIFVLASPKYNPNRKFAHVFFDVLLPNGQVPHYTSHFLAKDYIIPIRLTTHTEETGTIVDSISYACDRFPLPSPIYLARLDQEIIEDDIIQSNLGNLTFESFEVFSNGKLLGKYECKSEKDRNTKYFHFIKYTFVPSSPEQ